MLYFPHIPKTGGQTLLDAFYSAFGEAKIIKVWDVNFGADVHPDDFEFLEAEFFAGRSVVAGHLPLSKFLKNKFTRKLYENDSLRIITSVRNPIERLISLYNYIKLNKWHPENAMYMKFPLTDFLIESEPNFQFNFLKTEELCSIDKVLEKIHVCQIEASISQFSSFFKTALGIDVGSVDVRNRTIDSFPDVKEFASLSDLSPDFISKLTKKHALDFSLYELARGM